MKKRRNNPATNYVTWVALIIAAYATWRAHQALSGVEDIGRLITGTQKL